MIKHRNYLMIKFPPPKLIPKPFATKKFSNGYSLNTTTKEANGCCMGSFVLKFPLKEICGKEKFSNGVSLYVHGKLSRLGGVWHWYCDAYAYSCR